MDKALRLALIQVILNNTNITIDEQYDTIALIPSCRFDDEAELFVTQILLLSKQSNIIHSFPINQGVNYDTVH